MIGVVLGNVFSLLAMGADTLSASRKTAKGVLWVQILGQLCYGASALALKGYSAVVQNVVSVFRNLCALYPRCPQWIYGALVAAGVVFGIVFNNLGIIGWLPIIANLFYSAAVFVARGDAFILKAAFLVLTLIFVVFNALILNVVGAVGNVVVVITTGIYLVKEWKKRKAEV